LKETQVFSVFTELEIKLIDRPSLFFVLDKFDGPFVEVSFEQKQRSRHGIELRRYVR
jgi:hypothetical protein